MLIKEFRVPDFDRTKEQLLIWGNHFSSCCFLDNNQYRSRWQQQECVLAVGSVDAINPTTGKALEQLEQFIRRHEGQWVFGHFSYDLKNQIDTESMAKPSAAEFAPLYFFVPQTVIQLSPLAVIISSQNSDPKAIWEAIWAAKNAIASPVIISEPEPQITKAQYLQTIQKLKDHIHRGDCYEINFCQEFVAGNTSIDPLRLYRQLSQLSPNPFCCYYKINEAHLICASPERYLMKKGSMLFSQPIKGTAARHMDNISDDANAKAALRSDSKERSENVMIVDLVRNDLSKICKEGSVKVDELFEVYTYPQVHQMISTISGEVAENIAFTDIIKATFPMGSMTGAPKKRVLELIDQYESGSRGIFSGSVGYLNPSGDFDFNVVIRSLIYNNQKHSLSYWVGSGITWYSQPEREYEECMLKATAIKKVLQEQHFQNT